MDQFEDEEAFAFGFLEAVQRPDVGVIQRGEEPGLAFEARESIRR